MNFCTCAPIKTLFDCSHLRNESCFYLNINAGRWRWKQKTDTRERGGPVVTAHSAEVAAQSARMLSKLPSLASTPWDCIGVPESFNGADRDDEGVHELYRIPACACVLNLNFYLATFERKIAFGPSFHGSIGHIISKYTAFWIIEVVYNPPKIVWKLQQAKLVFWWMSYLHTRSWHLPRSNHRLCHFPAKPNNWKFLDRHLHARSLVFLSPTQGHGKEQCWASNKSKSRAAVPLMSTRLGKIYRLLCFCLSRMISNEIHLTCDSRG